jgi:hypothetical protein
MAALLPVSSLHGEIMNELIEAALSQAVRTQHTGDLIEKLLELPQARCNVRHMFGLGVYMRELSAPAGTLIVGRTHAHAHDCILVRGALTFFNADGTKTEARSGPEPLEFRAEPGRKIARVDEDITFVNVFATDLRDVEALEREIFTDEPPQDTRPMLEADGDYEAMLKEQGASPDAVRRASERTDDCCPFPDGVYKCKVGRSRIEGRGLIATADIAVGEFIAPGVWDQKRTPAGRFTNHARTPNAGFVYDAAGLAWLACLRPIQGSDGGYDGDEITVDYRRTPRARWEELT